MSLNEDDHILNCSKFLPFSGKLYAGLKIDISSNTKRKIVEWFSSLCQQVNDILIDHNDTISGALFGPNKAHTFCEETKMFLKDIGTWEEFKQNKKRGVIIMFLVRLVFSRVISLDQEFYEYVDGIQSLPRLLKRDRD